MKYQKRIHWDQHRPEFLKLGFIFSLAIAFMAFNYTTRPPVIDYFEEAPIQVDFLITPPPTIQEKKSTPPPPPPPKKNIVVLDIEPVTEPTITFEPKVEIKENTELIIDEYANDPITEPAPKVEIVKEELPEEEGPLLMAERMPIYGDCDVESEENTRRACSYQNLHEYIYSVLKYPAMAREYEVEGTVVVSFVVNKEGWVEDIEILKDIGMGCGEAVKKTIKKLGRFLPGKQNGRPVAVIHRLPVKFKLQ
ncbi:MAG: TonB family protein [Bacteroidota bacterium]